MSRDFFIWGVAVLLILGSFAAPGGLVVGIGMAAVWLSAWYIVPFGKEYVLSREQGSKAGRNFQQSWGGDRREK